MHQLSSQTYACYYYALASHKGDYLKGGGGLRVTKFTNCIPGSSPIAPKPP